MCWIQREADLFLFYLNACKYRNIFFKLDRGRGERAQACDCKHDRLWVRIFIISLMLHYLALVMRQGVALCSAEVENRSVLMGIDWNLLASLFLLRTLSYALIYHEAKKYNI